MKNNENSKIIKGQFFTKEDYWLKDKKQIVNFIEENTMGKNIILDPFYGKGDLFLTLKKVMPNLNMQIMGFDIDSELLDNKTIFYNDSLLEIPKKKFVNPNNCFLITNPPYLAKTSAKRKGLNFLTNSYYNQSGLNDLYKIALKTMIDFGAPGIAIVPESFINSNFFIKIKKHINLITTIIPNPFEDTNVPICVVCFNGKKQNSTLFYINNKFIYDFEKFIELKNRTKSKSKYLIKFNSSIGQIGLKAIDSSGHKDIGFIKADSFKYSKENIKFSSRMMTYLYIDEKILNQINLDQLIYMANMELEFFRNETKDLVFTPFKGNINNDIRRRRLDYKTARWILEKTIANFVIL